jgi:hypothetical protein
MEIVSDTNMSRKKQKLFLITDKERGIPAFDG